MGLNVYSIIILIIVVAVIAFTLAYFGSKKPEDYQRLTMHNTASSLVVASIIASTVSFASVYIALAGHVELSHQEVFVDILSILVTVLMGWNIISVVDFKNKMEKIDTLSKDFDHVIAGIMKLNMYSFPMRGNVPALINSCFKSLEELVKCEDVKVNEGAILQNMQLLHTILESIEPSVRVYVFKGKKRKYQYILDQIKRNEFKDEIQERLSEAEELPLKESSIRIEYEPIGGIANATTPNTPGSVNYEMVASRTMETSEMQNNDSNSHHDGNDN